MILEWLGLRWVEQLGVIKKDFLFDDFCRLVHEVQAKCLFTQHLSELVRNPEWTKILLEYHGLGTLRLLSLGVRFFALFRGLAFFGTFLRLLFLGGIFLAFRVGIRFVLPGIDCRGVDDLQGEWLFCVGIGCS